MADLIPGALILRLLLAPDDFLRVAIAPDDSSVFLDRERIELLDPHQRDVRDAVVAALLREVEVNLAASEDDARDGVVGQRLDLFDDRLETAASELGKRR